MFKRLTILFACLTLLSGCFLANPNTIALEAGIYQSGMINEHLDGVGMVNQFQIVLSEIDQATYNSRTNNIVIDRMNKTYYQVDFTLTAINKDQQLDLKYLGMKFDRYRYDGTYSYFDIIVTLDAIAKDDDRAKLDYFELRFHIYEAGDNYQLITNLVK